MEQNFGTFNMETKTIDFNGQTYNYTTEQLCSDSQSLKIAYNYFKGNKSIDIFPQGDSYIASLFEMHNHAEENIIILSNRINEQTTWFYFPLNKYEDLCYSELYRLLDKEKILIKFTQYQTDNYPQGREYCSKLLNSNLNNDECFCIVTRQDGEKWTRYYFKSNYIQINPTKVFLYRGRSDLINLITIINRNKSSIIPQGIENCIDIIRSQIEANGEVYVVRSSEKSYNNTYNTLWHYFKPDQFITFCTHIGRHKCDNNLIECLKKLEDDSSYVFPQGLDNCINFLEETMEKGEYYRVFIKKMKRKEFFFYFNDNTPYSGYIPLLLNMDLS